MIVSIVHRQPLRAGLRVAAWMLLAPLACGAGPRQIRLGIIAPSDEADSPGILRGARLAIAEANEEPGAAVALEVRSEAGQWGTAGNDAVVLVGEKHVDAIIAPSDGAANHLVLQVSGRMRVPVASLSSDSSVMETGVPWAVCIVPRADLEIEALIGARRLDPGSPDWWAIVPTEHPGRAVRHDLARAVRSTGARLGRTLEAGAPGSDVTPMVRLIVAAAPGGVLVWLPPSQAGALVAALRRAGFGGTLAGPCSIDSPDFVAAAGAAATGVLVAEFKLGSGAHGRANRFEERFTLKYGMRPYFSAEAAYDAVRVLVENLRKAGEDAGYRQFPPVLPTEGITGDIHFDPSGSRSGALRILACELGRFVPVNPEEYDRH